MMLEAWSRRAGLCGITLLSLMPGLALAAQTPGDSGPARPLPHDLSPWGMFEAADMVVKSVMVGLAAAAFLTVTILLAKTAESVIARHGLRRGLRIATTASSLEAAARLSAGRSDPACLMIDAAVEEMTLTGAAIEAGGLKARIASALSRIEIHSAARLARGTGILASIGSVGPFVGLFGTVWGIMNAFIGISEAETTNLAVVAPGIAEALLATAIGLVAAIPAVIVYNGLQRANASYRRLLGDAASAVERLASRDLDRRAMGIAPRATAYGQAAE